MEQKSLILDMLISYYVRISQCRAI